MTETSADVGQFRIVRSFDAPRDLLFAVWTDPEHLVKWWGTSMYPASAYDADARVGGALRYCMRGPNGDEHWASGEFREVVPPERLAWTTTLENAPYATLITVTFAERHGRTEITLDQKVLHDSGFPGAKYAEKGLGQSLDRLEAYLTTLA